MATNQHNTRRAFLKGLPVVTAAIAAPVMAQATETPVMALFRQWEYAHTAGNDMSLTEAESEAWCEVMSDLERRIVNTPSQTAQDVAAKVLAWTNYGDYTLDWQGGAAFWEEAKRLVAL